MKIHPSIVTLFITASAALASPTGLNNIPTADTPPQGTFVLQTYSTFGSDRAQDFNLGFKTGIDAKIIKLEVGADSHISPGPGGPVIIQGKAAYSFGDHLPTLALGAANLAFTEQERARSGNLFAYGVLTQDFGWFRAHAGCGYQQSDGLPFVGIDKTFRISKKQPVRDGKAAVGRSSGKDSSDGKTEVETRDLFTLRADAIEMENHSWLSSVGVLVPICKYFVFETWGNLPSDGAPVSVTVKGNFVFTF